MTEPITLFELPEQEELLPARMRQMQREHGAGPPDATCKDCQHLVCVSMSRNYYKCVKSHVSGSNATDWRVSWPACGLYAPTTADEPQRHIRPSH